jgi:hypothetical protein
MKTEVIENHTVETFNSRIPVPIKTNTHTTDESSKSDNKEYRAVVS